MAATVTAKQQRHQQDSMRHMHVGGSGDGHGDDELDCANKIGASRESSWPDKANDDDDCGEVSASTTTAMTTRVAPAATLYDVEHLATFSTAASHETATAGAAPSAAVVENNCDAQDELATSNFKLNNHRRARSSSNASSSADGCNNNDHDNSGGKATANPSAAEPRVALQKLFELEKLSGIWTQRMQIELRDDFMLILDCETNSIVERFHRNRVHKPESFNHYNDIYDNIIVFTIVDQLPESQGQDKKKTSSKGNRTDRSQFEPASASAINSENNYNAQDSDDQIGDISTSCDNQEQPTGELHIFQCVSHKAQQLVSDIVAWKQRNVDLRRQDNTKSSLSQSASSSVTNDKMIKKKASASTTAGSDASDQSHHHVSTSDSSTNEQLKLQQHDSKQTNKSGSSKRSSSLAAAAGEGTNSISAADMSKTNRVSAADAGTSPLDSESGFAKPVVKVTSSSTALSENVPLVNVNVKETVQVFNQIAALREKGSGTPQTARPISLDNSSSGPNAPAQAPASTATATTPTSDGSRVSALSSVGQFYKQRSIRASLAPKLDGTGDELANGKLAADQAGSSSSMASSANSSNNKLMTTGAPSSASSIASGSASSSSRSEHYQHQHQHHNEHNNHSRLLHSSSSHKNHSNNNHQQQQHHHHNHRDGGAFLANEKHHHQHSHAAVQAAKQIGHTNSGATYAQSNQTTSSAASNHHHGHHNHNNNHHHKQQQPAIGKDGTKLSSKLSSSSSCSSSAATATTTTATAAAAAAAAAASTTIRPHSSSNNKGSLLPQHHSSSDFSNGSPSSQQSSGQQLTPLEQVTTNESYVSVLNHCFDDIEKFIIRLQQSYAAMQELQSKRRLKKKSNHQLALAAVGVSQQGANKLHSNGLAGGVGGGSLGCASQAPHLPPLTASELAMLSSQARGPAPDDFFEILSKFKLAFNLLAKLKGCIHEPNAPELVHFLFTPLAIIIESARNVSPPVDPTIVGIPYLNRDALDLLSNCCTSKESDLWLSLGPNWTQTIDPSLLKASRLPSSFQPIFSDGWAPVITELELIGLVVSSSSPAQSELDHYRSSRLLCGPPPIGSNEPSFVSSRYGGASTKHKHHHQRGLRAGRDDSLGISEPSGKSSSNGMLANNNKAFKKRGSPTGGNGNSRHYSDPSKAHLTSPTPYGGNVYMHEPEEPMEGNPSHLLDSAHSNQLWSAKIPSVQRSARHSAQMNDKPGRIAAEHLMQTSGGRRKSDFPGGYGQFSPQMGSYLDDNGRPSYLPENLSDDYTELQGQDCYDGGNLPPRRALLARQGGHRRGPNVEDYLPVYAAGNRNVPSYNDHYLPQAPYTDDQNAHDFSNTAKREAMLADLGPAQTEWFYELLLRGALIVRVLFTRDANNDKELTVKRGEILEILDDSRKWWKARNINLQVAYVPHTIVAVMEHYQTLDELLTNSPGEITLMANDEQAAFVNSQRYARSELQLDESNFNQIVGLREDKRNSKTSGRAFRYF